MGLFDDLQRNTKTKQEFAQSQKEAQEQKRINALDKKIKAIKNSICEETKVAASKGVRNITIEPYYLCEDADSNYYHHMSFHTRPPYIVKGHMYKPISEHSPWYDLYDLSEDLGNYGYIIPEDRVYIITAIEDFLRTEGFNDFCVDFEDEYRYPDRKIFKSPTGRSVLKIHLKW